MKTDTFAPIKHMTTESTMDIKHAAMDDSDRASDPQGNNRDHQTMSAARKINKTKPNLTQKIQ